jgi:hypothetical protein
MARIPKQFLADDGTIFQTAGEAHAHNNRPEPGVKEFLEGLELPQRKYTEYVRLLNAWEHHNQADQR